MAIPLFYLFIYFWQCWQQHRPQAQPLKTTRYSAAALAVLPAVRQSIMGVLQLPTALANTRTKWQHIRIRTMSSAQLCA